MPTLKLNPTELEAISWHVSTYSEGGGGSCVEAGPVAGQGHIAVRDTKDRARGHFTVSRTVWATFVRSVTR